MNRIRILIPMILCSMILCSTAGEVTSTHRIIGLCSPDRQDDLRQVMSAVPEVRLVSFDYDKAEATFRYDVEQLIPPAGRKPPDRSPEKVTQKLNDLLRQASKGTFTITAPSTLPANQLTRLDFKLGVLDCKGCRYTAYIAIAKMEGVERATINSETHTLTAWIDPTKTNRAALENALQKAKVPLSAQ